MTLKAKNDKKPKINTIARKMVILGNIPVENLKPMLFSEKNIKVNKRKMISRNAFSSLRK